MLNFVPKKYDFQTALLFFFTIFTTSFCAYLPNLTPSGISLFASMECRLAEHRFTSYDSVRKLLDNWFSLRREQLLWRGIHALSQKWAKRVLTLTIWFPMVSGYLRHRSFFIDTPTDVHGLRSFDTISLKE